MLSRKALICGTPHRKTKTLRMIQGIQALITWPRVYWAARRSCSVSWTTCAPTGWAACMELSRVVDSQSSFGLQPRRNRVSAAMETIAATTSTSQGPWKFDTRNCGSAKATPATSRAGQI